MYICAFACTRHTKMLNVGHFLYTHECTHPQICLLSSLSVCGWIWQCENFDDANQALTEGKMLLELGFLLFKCSHACVFRDVGRNTCKGMYHPRGE